MELTGFQKASTDSTVTVKPACAACEVGEPKVPDGEPGETVWPGRITTSFANGPAATEIALLVPLFVPLVTEMVLQPAA